MIYLHRPQNPVLRGLQPPSHLWGTFSTFTSAKGRIPGALMVDPPYCERHSKIFAKFHRMRSLQGRPAGIDAVAICILLKLSYEGAPFPARIVTSIA